MIGEAMATVLVVDDNAKIVEVLVEYLLAAGYDAVSAFDGPSAVERFEERKPDIALLDVMLPGIDGLDLTRRFQAEGVPVILVTARGDEVDRLVGLELGADDYITKPFSPREVVARVKAVLRRCTRTETSGRCDSRWPARHRSRATGGSRRRCPRRADPHRVRHPLHPCRAPRPRLHAASAARGRLGRRLRRLRAHDRRAREEHPQQARREADGERFMGTVIGVGYKVEA